jgi:hypothetical protein
MYSLQCMTAPLCGHSTKLLTVPRIRNVHFNCSEGPVFLILFNYLYGVSARVAQATTYETGTPWIRDRSTGQHSTATTDIQTEVNPVKTNWTWLNSFTWRFLLVVKPVDACFENILASIQISVFCDVPPCSLVERFQHFSRAYFIHLRIQSRRATFLHWKWRNPVPLNHCELDHT